jgi:GTP-sensing pleiotropic transcriptional regulator CodY
MTAGTMIKGVQKSPMFEEQLQSMGLTVYTQQGRLAQLFLTRPDSIFTTDDLCYYASIPSKHCLGVVLCYLRKKMRKISVPIYCSQTGGFARGCITKYSLKPFTSVELTPLRSRILKIISRAEGDPVTAHIIAERLGMPRSKNVHAVVGDMRKCGQLPSWFQMKLRRPYVYFCDMNLYRESAHKDASPT